MWPQVKTVVEVRAQESTKNAAETPPFAVVAQQTMLKPARGKMADFRVKRWRLSVVSRFLGEEGLVVKF